MNVIVFESEAFEKLQQSIIESVKEAVKDINKDMIKDQSNDNDWVDIEEAKKRILDSSQDEAYRKQLLEELLSATWRECRNDYDMD